MYLIGIDIGGSHVGFGLVDVSTSAIITSIDVSINGKDIAAQDLVQIIVDNCYKLLDSNGLSLQHLRAIGMGSPGQVNNNKLIAAANFPRLVEVPLAEMVSKGMRGVYTKLVNDADAAMSAEVWGNEAAYSKFRNIVMVTLGTGVGYSLILNGRIYQGANGLIEGGHMIVNSNFDARKCGCGQSGCVESYSSARSTVQRMQECDAKDNLPATSPADGKGVFDRFLMNDFNAVKVVEETGEYLAVLAINTCRVLDPEVIIFGGGLAKAGSVLLDVIKKHMKLRTWTVLPTDVKLVLALTENNGVLGAALAANSDLSASSTLSLETSEALVPSPKAPSSSINSIMHPDQAPSDVANKSTSPIHPSTPPKPTRSATSLSSSYGIFIAASAFAMLAAEQLLVVDKQAKSITTYSAAWAWQVLKPILSISQIGIGLFLSFKSLQV